MLKHVSLLIFWMLVFSGLSAQHELIVSGRITNENGQPLKQVNVFEVGVNNQVQSSSNGMYSLTIRHNAAIIRFSYSGYEMQEVRIIRSANRDIVLKQAGKLAVNGIRSGSAISNTPVANTTGEEGSENAFQSPLATPVSAYSVNVDGNTYSNVYRYGLNAQMPFEKLVRIEELINYFQYDYPKPAKNAEHPFTVTTETAPCPWNKQHKLLAIGLQGKEIPAELLPASNLVFLIDASGSMQDPMKLAMVKASMKLLAQQLRGQDIVSVVAYAGSAGLNLPATPGNKKATIEKAIDALEPGGYTAGAAGIKMAYRIANQNFIKAGNNRIILCTDGDFNVGISSDEAIDSLIEAERKSGVMLTVLGFGTGNRQVAKMKRWAEIGNGTHAFISSLNEAKRIFVNEFASTLYTIARDVKPQVSFNPAKVQAYRLIGYDTKSANKPTPHVSQAEEGELGSGHCVTALYEIIPAGLKTPWIDSMAVKQYSKPSVSANLRATDLALLQINYTDTEDEAAKVFEKYIADSSKTIEASSENWRFAAAVAAFGMLLRDSDFKQKASFKEVIALAKTATGKNTVEERTDFIVLAENMRRVAKQMGREK